MLLNVLGQKGIEKKLMKAMGHGLVKLHIETPPGPTSVTTFNKNSMMIFQHLSFSQGFQSRAVLFF